LHGRDLAKRNRMIYTVRDTDSAEEWAERVLADKETSAIEAHSTWLEELARIVSGGIKPGSGVDLQTQDADGVVQLYAIQSAANTKNAGGRKSDIESLRRGARPLRGHRQRVELNIAMLGGRGKTSSVRAQPGHNRAQCRRLLGADQRHPRLPCASAARVHDPRVAGEAARC
jgi:hypothetical protein